jgi:hypothetical protein
MYSRLPSDEQTVKVWFRNYSSGLAIVGIRLGLSPAQQSELEDRLVAVVCQGFDTVTATKGSVRSKAVVDRSTDPIRSRWLDDHVSVQGDTWTGS